MMLWIKRTFEFSTPPEMFPMVCERLRGTPVRVEEKVNTLLPAMLTRRIGETWSIAETVGHLGDVERLWDLRMDDFLAGRKELYPADMSNRRTKESNHNETSIETLLMTFRTARERFLDRLDGLEEKDVVISALHPRLNKQMRIIDLAFFAAEHDDHHLARMTQLIRELP